MSKQSLIIYKIPVLYNILNEIRENFKFNLYNFSEKYDFQKISRPPKTRGKLTQVIPSDCDRKYPSVTRRPPKARQ